MPGGDGTGPYGQGPKTGRGFGFCSGNDTAGYNVPSAGSGRRAGRARGRGRGMGGRFGHGYGRFYGGIHPEISRETMLEIEARILKDQLASIEKELSELKKKAD